MDKETLNKAIRLQNDIDKLDDFIKSIELVKENADNNEINYSVKASYNHPLIGNIEDIIPIPCGLEREMIQCLIINARNLKQAYEADLKDL